MNNKWLVVFLVLLGVVGCSENEELSIESVGEDIFLTGEDVFTKRLGGANTFKCATCHNFQDVSNGFKTVGHDLDNAAFRPTYKGEALTELRAAVNNCLEHWMNGEKVVEAEVESDDWNKRIAASKFATWEKFGKSKKGHISFQDHKNPVWYRNITIKTLD